MSDEKEKDQEKPETPADPNKGGQPNAPAIPADANPGGQAWRRSLTMDELCRDRECKWYSETLEHYVHDHEQMEEILEEEMAVLP